MATKQTKALRKYLSLQAVNKTRTLNHLESQELAALAPIVAPILVSMLEEERRSNKALTAQNRRLEATLKRRGYPAQIIANSPPPSVWQDKHGARYRLLASYADL